MKRSLLFPCILCLLIGLLLGDLMMALMDPRINLVKKGGER